MSFEQIKITDVLVIAVLGVALLMAIFYGNEQLAMSIASGLIGYVGGASRAHQDNKNMEAEKK